MTLDVVCLGHAALDRVYTVDAIPAVATKVRASAFREVGGGMASNAACAIARLGGRVAFWGRAGDDAAGAAMAREFASYGVDATAFRRIAGFRSSQSAIVVDARGERLIVTHLGDAPDDAGWLPLDNVRAAGAVLADVRWPEGAVALFDAAHDAGVPSVLDADVADANVIDALVRRADHVVFSEHGLARWASLSDDAGATARLDALARAWSSMRDGARACAVTCGEAGVMVAHARGCVPRPGAGDRRGRHARRRRRLPRRVCARDRGGQRHRGRRALRDARRGAQVHTRRRPRRKSHARRGRGIRP
jgi:sulfofructose kinase